MTSSWSCTSPTFTRRGRTDESLARRRDAVSVEDGLDVANSLHARLECGGVPHLDHEAILDHRVHDCAAGLEDVDPGLGEGPGEVFEQAGAVPRIHLQLYAQRRRAVPLPLDLREALRVAHQCAYVRAVLVVDGDALPKRDVADDVVAGNRPAALGKSQHPVVGHAVDADAVLRARHRLVARELL